MIGRGQLLVTILNGNGKSFIKSTFFKNNPMWSLLEEHIWQNDTESVNVKLWTDFIYHLQAERADIK